MKNRQITHWLDVAEYAALAGVGVGSVMSAFAQQFLYATAPLSIAVLIEMGNRQRMQAQQAQATKRQLDDLNHLGASITTLTEHLQNIPSPEAIAVIEQAVGQQQQALDETVAYINTTYAALTNRLAEFESQNTQQDVSELKVAHGSIHTLLINLQANLKQMTTRDQMESTERAIAQVQQKIRHLESQLTQLGEQTTPKLGGLQAQLDQLQQTANTAKEPSPRAPDFNEAKLNEIVNLMADLVPRRDWNTVTAQLQALQRQSDAQAEQDQRLETKIQALQQQLPNETKDSLAALHQRWQGLLETVQDKIQALPDLAGLDTILQEMLQRRLQTFPEQALPHQLLVDLPSSSAASSSAASSLAASSPAPKVAGEAALQAPPAPTEASTSRTALESALQTATRRVILTWPWASSYQLDARLTDQLEAFLKAGKTLHLGWCIAYSRQEFHLLAPIRQAWGLDPASAGRRAALQYLLQLKQRYPKHLYIKLLEQGDNFLIIDRQQAVIGIDPPLIPAADIQPLRLKVRTTSRSAVDSLIEQYRQGDRTASPADTLWRQAMAQADLGEGERAIAKLDALLADTPDGGLETAKIYNMRAVLHHEQRHDEAAVADLTQAISRAAADGVPYCNRGMLRHRQGDSEGAIADFDQAMGLMPSSLPLFYRGRCWETLERYSQAVEDYSRVLAAQPQLAIALWRRAIAHQHLGQIDQAQQDMHSAAWAFIQQNNSGAARRCLQQLEQWQAEPPLLDSSLASLQRQRPQEHLAS